VTYALLKHDFGLGLEIPIDQLCPPVPNRANYIYWLHDLLHTNSPQLFETPGTRVRGLDVYASALPPPSPDKATST
jgi:23S rRNA A1618 N6-methylase RlmF